MATMKCPRCGSEKIIPNLLIQDSYQLMQKLEIAVESKPNALIFKQSHREALRANVCGECGNVGLSVENPKELWETYSQGQNS